MTESKEIAKTETGSAILSIADLAKDKDMTPEKLNMFIDAQIKIMDKQAEIDFNRDRAAMQAELPIIEERHRNTQTNSWYAKIEDINDAIAPCLSKYGFSVAFETEFPEKMVKVTAVLLHRSGHAAKNTVQLPLDEAGIKGTVNKTALHAVGSSLTYARRYSLDGLLNLKFKNKDNKPSSLDDDGNLGGAQTIDEKTQNEIRQLIEDTGTDTREFCQLAGVESIPEIPLFYGGQALMMLKAKKKGLKKVSDAQDL